MRGRTSLIVTSFFQKVTIVSLEAEGAGLQGPSGKTETGSANTVTTKHFLQLALSLILRHQEGSNSSLWNQNARVRRHPQPDPTSASPYMCAV